jgi:hypothetical protein
MDRYGSVCVVTRQWSGRPRKRSSIPVRSSTLYLLYERPWEAVGPPGLLSKGLRIVPRDMKPTIRLHLMPRVRMCGAVPPVPIRLITLRLTTTSPPHRLTLPLLPSVCAHSCPCVVYPRKLQAVVQWWRRRLRPARRPPALYTHASSARRCVSRPQRRRVRCVWFEGCKQTDGA